jgi:hypothetical protein
VVWTCPNAAWHQHRQARDEVADSARSHVEGLGSHCTTWNGSSHTCKCTALGKSSTVLGKSTTRQEIHGIFLRQTSTWPENDCSRGEGSRVDLGHGLSYHLLSCNEGLKHLAFRLLLISRFNLMIDAPRQIVVFFCGRRFSASLRCRGCSDGSLGQQWGRLMATDKPSDRTWGRRFIVVRILRVTNTWTVNLCPDRAILERRMKTPRNFTTGWAKGIKPFWIGPDNKPGEVAISTTSSEIKRRKPSNIQWLGPSGCWSWFSFEDDGGT